ncbi:hypothetical protein BGW36DRAFT_370847 [Talaromyces proteolyticus]|uniref:Uncharacterized protein n=1 Tax=Talaromyces proteolyticus TaxID=1131652 RepID=A0AAD4Q0K1_9EURO|nr:uncharacterized protein BGW36DRAFT_370847 [Talaromyces proteolyticus]KAH8704193.1 hypothetical protein BGW36DRAFT_370847 [Talaromyces proteolyticus]
MVLVCHPCQPSCEAASAFSLQHSRVEYETAGCVVHRHHAATSSGLRRQRWVLPLARIQCLPVCIPWLSIVIHSKAPSSLQSSGCGSTPDFCPLIDGRRCNKLPW